MRLLAVSSAALFVVSSGALIGCGGGGHGFRSASNPVRITSNALPATSSGQEINYPIPFTGGSGGPYVLTVIDGELPPGVETDDVTVALIGRLLEDGVYDFTLQLTDTGSQPFSTSIMTFHWDVPKGALVFATDPTLPPWVFNQFGSVTLVVAGGTAPYTCDVAAGAEALPNGLIIPDPSCTIVGAPIGIKAVAPFVYLVNIRATDSTPPSQGGPLTVIQQFTITVLVPPVVVTTTTLANGKCGVAYSDQILIADGIPPFLHTVVDAIGSQTRLRGPAPSLSPIAKGSPGSAYALDATAGPYTGKFPEGLILAIGPINGPGVLSGKPRRAGIFNSWIYHVQSNTLPATPSQNAWKAFSFTMADGNPPAVVLSTAVLTAGSTFATPPGTTTSTNLLTDADINRPYSKQFTGTGGVAFDGFSDAPGSDDRVVDGTEVVGQYNWTHTVAGPVVLLSTVGMTFTATGELRGTGPSKEVGSTRTSFISLTVTADDVQLPKPTSAAHKASGTCRFSIGPDRVIITEGLATHVATSVNANFAPLGTINHVSFEYNDQTVAMYEPFGVGPGVRALASGDLAATHTLPVATTLDLLLKNIDMMPITVNPTWWAYDAYNVNTRAARALMHSDLQRQHMGQGYNTDGSGSTGFSIANSGQDTYERNGDAAIELPNAKDVPGIPEGTFDALTTGVYANGGTLRAFENTTWVGFFIVRKDGKIDVPFALNKSLSGIAGFGDSVLTSNLAASSVFRRLQITVSPNGRFAATKLKTTVNSFSETSLNQRIALFSLTGEKVFGGTTYRMTSSPGGTGGVGTAADGLYLYGDSMTLTNRALYFLKGNNQGNTAVIYDQHFVYRLDSITGAGNPALLAPTPAGGIGGGMWTNFTARPLCTPFHRWGSPGATNVQSMNWGASNGTSFTTTGNPSRSSQDFYGFQWANFAENSSAPMPLRVNANGDTVVIVAADGVSPAIPGPQGSHTQGTTNFQSYGVYTDVFDAGASLFRFRSIAATRRRFSGATRLSGVRRADQSTRMYGWHQGPATQLEVSDDGKLVAAVYNAYTGTNWVASGFTNFANTGAREDVWTARATTASSDPWTTVTEATPTALTFTGSMNWKFGAFAFTRNASTSAGAIVFFGGTMLPGAQLWDTDNTYCNYVSGTLFQWLPGAANVSGILPVADGGNGLTSYTSGSPNSIVPAAWDGGNRGSVMPWGYFLSNDGKFVYYESGSPLTTSDPTPGRLVGVNIGDTTTTINTRLPVRGFAVTPWPSSPPRGFGPDGGNTDYFRVDEMFGTCSGQSNQRVQQAVSAYGANGTVFFIGYQQRTANGTNTVDVSAAGVQVTYYSYYGSFTYTRGAGGWYGGGPTNTSAWGDQSQFSGELMAFNANIGGGVSNLSNFGSSESTSRMIFYMQPNALGTKVALLTGTPVSAGAGYHYGDREQIHAVTDISFSATGALSTTPSRFAIEATNGRAGPSMSWDSTDTKLYYAFGAAAGNENAMALKEARLNGTGTAVSGTTTQTTGLAGTAARFAVLQAGR